MTTETAKPVLYDMLMTRIDELMRVDPPKDSADGIRLVELVDLCEKFESLNLPIG